MNEHFSNIQEIDQEVIEKIIAEILARSEYKKDRPAALKTALSMLDLTTLEGSDNTEKVKALCIKAKSYQEKNLPNVAAVCVYPTLVAIAKKELQGTNIHVA
ncbi:MAG: deoxyribose-phosphate aldolase, partial [Bacteroidota bacterium]